jgi:hypothetical protein
MDEIINPADVDLEKEIALKESIEAFAQHDHMNWNIKQLLKEANDAKEKGQWEKAQKILWELRKITRNNIDTRI